MLVFLPCKCLFSISVLFEAIVIVIVKNDHLDRLYFLNIFFNIFYLYLDHFLSPLSLSLSFIIICEFITISITVVVVVAVIIIIIIIIVFIINHVC